jgi:uncharacterized protein (DUF1684 family)
MRFARAGAATRAFRRRAGRRVVLLPVLCTALAAAGAAACDPTTKPAATYAERVAAQRREKDGFFRTGADSPIPSDRHAEFLPLAYFAIDEAYNAPAVLTPSEREPAMEMPTSAGLRRQMRRAGTLRFSLKGQPLQLTAFVEAEAANMNRLFVPFGDLTNGTETYAAGRYIDLERTVSGLYEVDFNRAYHPYCFYDPKYDCPYPPPENRLKLPIRAGERARK